MIHRRLATFVALCLASMGCDLAIADLVFSECVDPTEAEHKCNVDHLDRMKNAREWCRLEVHEPANAGAPSAPYNACIERKKMASETARAECILKIKKCPPGKVCRNEQCVST